MATHYSALRFMPAAQSGNEHTMENFQFEYLDSQ